MRNFDLFTLRLFVAVCDSRSIARVAEQHHMVASAVSKRLTQLEEGTRLKLLERSRRGIQLTPAGETLLEHARAMLGSADRAARDMAEFGSGIQGKVRVLATVSVVAEYLPDDVAAFMQRPEYANIQVDMEEALSSDIARQLHAGSASLGICWDAAKLDGLMQRPYRADNLAIVAHPSHPLSKLKQCSFRQTLDYDHVGLPSSTAGHALLARAAALEGRQMQYRAVLSTFDAAMRVVRANLGISVIPIEIAEPYANALKVRIIPLSDKWALRRFSICYLNESALSSAARSLADFLVERAKP